MAESDLGARRPLSSRNSAWASACARSLTRAGVSPNAISVASTFFAAAAGLTFFASAQAEAHMTPWLFCAGAALVQARLICNLLDGMVAVEGGRKTKSGEIFNELPDRISDPFILVGAGFALGSSPTLGWLAAALALLTAYVRALGVAAGGSQQFIGPMAKPQRMAVITIAALAQAVLLVVNRPLPVIQYALWLIIVGCIVTVIRRTTRIIRELEAR